MIQDQQKNPKWWEKTVEYAFVLQCLPEAASIAPLSGASEQGVGDATLHLDEGYLLIEFKAQRLSMVDELEKYERAQPTTERQVKLARHARLESALKSLRALPQSDAHQLVFGHLRNGQLRTAHVRYTDALNRTVAPQWLSRTSVQMLPRRNQGEMLKYLEQLRALRGVDSDSGGTVVVGVSTKGCSMMTIEEFVQGEPSLDLSVAQAQILPPERSPQHAAERQSRELAPRSKGLSR